jgi:hypothetical protein
MSHGILLDRWYNFTISLHLISLISILMFYPHTRLRLETSDGFLALGHELKHIVT